CLLNGPSLCLCRGSVAISVSLLFHFGGSAAAEIYTLSLHDALPISGGRSAGRPAVRRDRAGAARHAADHAEHRPGRLALRRRRADRKSTRLNSSHVSISYAVFCLKKKKYLERRPIHSANIRV